MRTTPEKLHQSRSPSQFQNLDSQSWSLTLPHVGAGPPLSVGAGPPLSVGAGPPPSVGEYSPGVNLSHEQEHLHRGLGSPGRNQEEEEQVHGKEPTAEKTLSFFHKIKFFNHYIFAT